MLLGKQTYAEYVAGQQEGYRQYFEKLGLKAGEGVAVTCPECRHVSWFTTRHDERLWGDQIFIGCPTTCGYFGALELFAPRHAPMPPSGMDTETKCLRCQTGIAVAGVIYRCPSCAIENVREVMQATSDRVSEVAKQGGAIPRASLEMLLAAIVSTFDGVMRRMVAIANDNRRHMRLQPQQKGSALERRDLEDLPAGSFQNLEGARKRLLPRWDMASDTFKWTELVRLFQKRHLITHGLGVIDEDYVARAQDPAARVGRQVPLVITELQSGAACCVEIVRGFYGLFLS